MNLVLKSFIRGWCLILSLSALFITLTFKLMSSLWRSIQLINQNIHKFHTYQYNISLYLFILMLDKCQRPMKESGGSLWMVFWDLLVIQAAWWMWLCTVCFVLWPIPNQWSIEPFFHTWMGFEAKRPCITLLIHSLCWCVI